MDVFLQKCNLQKISVKIRTSNLKKRNRGLKKGEFWCFSKLQCRYIMKKLLTVPYDERHNRVLYKFISTTWKTIGNTIRIQTEQQFWNLCDVFEWLRSKKSKHGFRTIGYFKLPKFIPTRSICTCFFVRASSLEMQKSNATLPSWAESKLAKTKCFFRKFLSKKTKSTKNQFISNTIPKLEMNN